MDDRFVDRPDCWLCLRPGRRTLTDVRDDLFQVPGVWSIRECRPCGLAWVDPGPTPAGIAGLYERYSTHDAPPAEEGRIRGTILSGLRQAVFGYPEGSSWPGSLIGMLGAAVLPWRDAAGGTVMWQKGGPPRAVLDVGSGAGEFLARMKRYGWSVAGVEPDPKAASVARLGSDARIFTGSVEDSPFEPGTFDVVTLHHVVEHVLDPVGTLRRCRDLLKPGGTLVAVTPNVRSLGRRLFGADWRGWEVPRHINVFSPRSLREAARRAGFARSTAWTPSRAAAWFWRVAGDRRRARARTSLGRLRLGALEKVASTLFGALEHWLSQAAPCGEETAVMAWKAADRGA